jgi:hypothetical protein
MASDSYRHKGFFILVNLDIESIFKNCDVIPFHPHPEEDYETAN